MLKLVDVSKVYRMGDVTVPVLHDIQLQIPDGDLMVIVGPSGSGKSTLLNLVGGIDRPTAGEVWYGDRDLSKFSDRELTAYRREKIGFIFQFYNLVPTLTARENVLVSCEIANSPMEARDALLLVGLEERVNHFPSQLSGGEQQRVAIARAIAKNPELLLCDEPTGALDLHTGRLILGLLSRLQRELNKTVVIITHNSAIAGMAQHIVRIGSGTIEEARTNSHPIPAMEIEW